MQGGNMENITQNAEEVKIVNTNEDAKDGQNKCPKCGSTDISLNINNGKLRCNFCRHEFSAEKASGLESDIGELKGNIIASGASDIAADAKDVITIKCSSCGAEVVIDTASSTQARCHWCRNTLSINNKIPNGAVPDVVLPFKLSKEEARSLIEDFVGKRQFYAHPKFRQEFTTENIMGVYFPYMLVDVNAHANFVGEGEHLVRSYTVTHGDNEEHYYDADVYSVMRDFDLEIHGLTVESNSDRLDNSNEAKTNNIINSIMPFDIENCVKYDSNYIKGYTSEKRDANVSELKELVDSQAKDIARFAANESLSYYDRGVCWSSQNLDIKGEQWQAAYLPVWLYSYLEIKNDKKVLHYVAVNARTKETMGSVPIHIPRLLMISGIIEFFGFLMMLFVDWDYDAIFLLSGIIYYFYIYGRYRNKAARHRYEVETKRDIENLNKKDDYVTRRVRQRNSMMLGANNRMVTDASVATKISKNITARTEGVNNDDKQNNENSN